MNLSNFILLEQEEKRAILLHEGILVAKRTNFDCIVFLFQLNLFYVEVYGNIETKEVLEYRAFQGTDQLHPYLEKIQIDDLLK